MPTPVITGLTPSATTRTDALARVGFKFTVGATALSVTDLGRYVVSAGGAHTVRIIRVSDLVEMASASVNTAGGTPGTFVYTALGSAVTLAAGIAYYLVSAETNGDQWKEFDNALVSTGDVSLTKAVYSSDNTTYTESGGAGDGWVPPNFKYDLVSAGAAVKDVWGPMPV